MGLDLEMGVRVHSSTPNAKNEWQREEGKWNKISENNNSISVWKWGVRWILGRSVRETTSSEESRAGNDRSQPS